MNERRNNSLTQRIHKVNHNCIKTEERQKRKKKS